MDGFQSALLFAAVATTIVAWNLPHAALWILVAGVNFAAGSIYQHLGLPNHTFAVMMMDAAVCILTYFVAREVWETRLYNLYQLSVMISLLRLSGAIGSNTMYVVALELVNWAILALIGGTVMLNWIRADDHGLSHHDWRAHIHRVALSLREARHTPPFHKAR